MHSRGQDRIADALRLLAAGVSVVVAPTTATILSAAPDICDRVKRLAAASPPSVERLAADLAMEAQRRIAASREAPPDAEVLYHQMVEAGLLTPAEIMAHGMSASSITEAMLGKLTDPEHRRGPMQALFREVTVPVLTRLLSDRDFASDLTPAFMQSVLGNLAGIAEQLDQLDRLPRQALETLAIRFEIERIYDLSDPALREALEKRAEDYRNLRVEVEALRSLGPRVDNVLAEVEAALAELDLKMAENLLAGLRKTTIDKLRKPLEGNARVMEAQAHVALLRGHAENAFQILSAAADSFGALDPIEPARRRLHYQAILFFHGRRYGGDGGALTERMLRRAIEDLSTEPELWALAQSDLGNSFSLQADRAGGSESGVLLRNAEDAYHAALRVWTGPEHPEGWARVQLNLGNLYRSQARRDGGEAGTRAIARAAEAYRAAIRVLADTSEQWAGAHTNLGSVLHKLGMRLGGSEGAALLSDAAMAHRKALSVWTEQSDPVNWAIAQNNLGITLQNQGRSIEGSGGDLRLRRAIRAYRAALRVRTETAHPLAWATTTNNLGFALRALGSRTDGPAGVALLQEGVDALRATLRVRTEDLHPVAWATTCNDLGTALYSLGIRVGKVAGLELIDEAIGTLHAALRIRTRDAHPIDWANTMENLGVANEARAHLAGNSRSVLETAAGCYEAALQVYERTHMPFDHGTASEALSRVREKLAEG